MDITPKRKRFNGIACALWPISGNWARSKSSALSDALLENFITSCCHKMSRDKVDPYFARKIGKIRRIQETISHEK